MYYLDLEKLCIKPFKGSNNAVHNIAIEIKPTDDDLKKKSLSILTVSKALRDGMESFFSQPENYTASEHTPCIIEVKLTGGESLLHNDEEAYDIITAAVSFFCGANLVDRGNKYRSREYHYDAPEGLVNYVYISRNFLKRLTNCECHLNKFLLNVEYNNVHYSMLIDEDFKGLEKLPNAR